MLIAFPWHLTWNLNMPRGQKSAIRVLFASGIVCIFIATLRAAQITANTIKTHATMDGTWLAVWGMAETAAGKIVIYPSRLCHKKQLNTNSAAVIIGLCPSFAILIRATRKNNKKRSNDGGVFSFHFPTIGSAPTHPKLKKDPNAIDSLWTNTHVSQEELATKQDGMSITTTVHQDNESCGIAR
ncbi:hypothetical protein PTMSG1_09432 [Pyrenophora teres f. maculata]|nr:hypothetical protein PTMSG1_09432 [Pyrenophora teres f. maculata]